MCYHVMEDGGVKYRLVKNHTLKPVSICEDDCVCVYKKIGPGGGYYCFRHGKLFSECLEKEEGKMKKYFYFLNLIF